MPLHRGESEREACYQRQEAARADKQKAQAAREAEQSKPLEPMTSDDAHSPAPCAAFAGAARRPCQPRRYCAISGVFDET